MVTKKTDPPKRKRTAAAKKPKRELALWEKIVARGSRIPPEELARIPVDGSVNLDHYLYGSPKQEVD